MFSGKKICEELGILPEDLAKKCQTGEVLAYNREGLPILAGNKCLKKFKYPGNTIFYIRIPDQEGIIAINKNEMKILIYLPMPV